MTLANSKPKLTADAAGKLFSDILSKAILKGKAVVFDLDNTLCNCDHRIKYVLGKNKDYDRFNALHVDDKPIDSNIKLAQQLRENYQILIFTGRSIKYYNSTVKWLHTNGIYPSMIAMRPENNRAPNKALKLGFIRQFKKHGYDVRAIYDDDKSVRDHLIKYGYIAIDSKL